MYYYLCTDEAKTGWGGLERCLGAMAVSVSAKATFLKAKL